jgi:hypothetical protein
MFEGKSVLPPGRVKKSADDPFLHQSIKLPPEIYPQKTAVMYSKKYADYLLSEKNGALHFKNYINHNILETETH